MTPSTTIAIVLIKSNLDTEILEESLVHVRSVEQVVYNVLDKQGVCPVYRTLFGLKLFGHTLWLAPNLSFETIFKNLVNTVRPMFELRMRFRPSSFDIMLNLDVNAFKLIYAQLRHDFMRTKFNEDKRNYVLLNDSVFTLIVFDLWRYGLENDLNHDQILKHVNPKDYFPKRASKFQRMFSSLIADKISLQKLLKNVYESGEKDVNIVKKRFVELFLNEVAPDYGSEIYSANHDEVTKHLKNRPIELRVSYHQKDDESRCVITTRPQSSIKAQWVEMCVVDDVSCATLNGCIVLINRNNAHPVKFKFSHNLFAKSFLSSINGYYRLMRKWNFNICQDVSSPELDFLKRNKCHGSIGYETASLKLSQQTKAESFLIRKCQNRHNRFLIDTMIQNRNSRLIINVDWVPEKKGYRVCKDTSDVIRFASDESNDVHSSLEQLINSTHVGVDIQCGKLQQLKHWIIPTANDDCPALLLSMSLKKLKEFQKNDCLNSNNTRSLPRCIPEGMLKMHDECLKGRNNGLIVKTAKFNNEVDVIVKCHSGESHYDTINKPGCMAFMFCPNDNNNELLCNLKPAQLRLADWIYVKHNLISETIGLDICNYSLVQEHFPFGPLDKFLADNSSASDIVRLFVAFQIADALAFLQDKQIIHGKLRCHNLMVHQKDPLRIKLTDPLGFFDASEDQAFVPREYFGVKGSSQICVKQFNTGVDVWAFGTTMWQIFENGKRPPPNRYANTLIKPQNCSKEVWALIETCWLDHERRAEPNSLYRDLNDILAWKEGAQQYCYISEDDSDHASIFQSYAETPKREVNQYPSLPSLENSTTQTNGVATFSLASNNFSDLVGSNGIAKKFPFRSTIMNLVQTTTRSRNREYEISNSLGSLKCQPSAPSESSFSHCSTPSDSEMTALTDLSDYESVSTAIDECLWYIDSRRLELGAEIGRGSSGVVIMGELEQADGQSDVVAVKRIHIDGTNAQHLQAEDLRRELVILKDLNHDNIVKMVGFVEDSSMMLVFEFMPLGSLLTCIKNSPLDHFQNLPLKKYAHDIAQGMDYLESKRIVHRDLALRNILVKSEQEVKIGDFGLARFMNQDDVYVCRAIERAWPIKWYAPEVLNTLQRSDIETQFSHKSDVWSYGIVLWEMYSGGSNPQYPGLHTITDHSDALGRGVRLSRPNDCRNDMWDLMMKCWSYGQTDRPTFKQISEDLKNKDECFFLIH